MDIRQEAQGAPPRRAGLTAIDGALALIAVLLVVQMWLLTAALENFLGGHPEVALPAAIVSAVLLLACGGLFLFLRAVDRDVRSARSLTRGKPNV